MKTIVVVQSFYLPWKGYFDRMQRADEVILYDNAQYQRRFWINRNQIKSAGGLSWLTIPVIVKGRFKQAIKDTKVADPNWNARHWEFLRRCYGKAPFFNECKDQFEDLFLNCREEYISRINFRFLSALCTNLGIQSKLTWSMDYELAPGRTERLVDLCQKVKADVYLSGPTAKAYLQEELFHQAGIQVEYMDYSGYPPYPQLFGPFRHEVSIIDLIFNTGHRAREYMKSFR
jgi:hypothetical protein